MGVVVVVMVVISVEETGGRVVVSLGADFSISIGSGMEAQEVIVAATPVIIKKAKILFNNFFSLKCLIFFTLYLPCPKRRVLSGDFHPIWCVF